MIALECHLCDHCEPGLPCPARLEDVPLDYAVGRRVNLIAAWHDELIDILWRFGMRSVRELRGRTDLLRHLDYANDVGQ